MTDCNRKAEKLGTCKWNNSLPNNFDAFELVLVIKLLHLQIEHFEAGVIYPSETMKQEVKDPK